MGKPIYILKHLNSIKKDLIIEEDSHSIWAYLLDSENDSRIILDGFICSTGTIVKGTSAIKEFIDKDFAPPISEDYVNNFTIQKDLTEIDFNVEVFDNKVIIFIKHDRFVILDYVNFNSYSKSVSKAGPYGLPIEKMED